ncbi:hypothetical protein SM033_00099 [Vibrio phage vB_VpaM_sm033]|nr:hypothetical protein SM033_00099 [Vibrio phage vB_VpaM_sm033]
MTFARSTSILTVIAIQVLFVSIYLFLRNQALPVLPEGMEWVTYRDMDILSVGLGYMGMWYFKETKTAAVFQAVFGALPGYIVSVAMLSWIGVHYNVVFSFLGLIVAAGSACFTGMITPYYEALQTKLGFFERLYAKL